MLVANFLPNILSSRSILFVSVKILFMSLFCFGSHLAMFILTWLSEWVMGRIRKKANWLNGREVLDYLILIFCLMLRHRPKIKKLHANKNSTRDWNYCTFILQSTSDIAVVVIKKSESLRSKKLFYAIAMVKFTNSLTFVCRALIFIASWKAKMISRAWCWMPSILFAIQCQFYAFQVNFLLILLNFKPSQCPTFNFLLFLPITSHDIVCDIYVLTFFSSSSAIVNGTEKST